MLFPPFHSLKLHPFNLKPGFIFHSAQVFRRRDLSLNAGSRFFGKMKDEPNLTVSNDNSNIESRNKREGDFDDLDSSVKKKYKTDALDSQEDKKQNVSNQNGSSEHKEQNISEVDFVIEADAAEDKGSRHTMEDAWVVLSDASMGFPGKLRCAHYAIYDGHGGRLAAEYAQKHLHANVLLAGLPRELLDVKAAKRAILDGFQRTDESLLQESATGGWQDGATAVCVWVLGQTWKGGSTDVVGSVVGRGLGNIPKVSTLRFNSHPKDHQKKKKRKKKERKEWGLTQQNPYPWSLGPYFLVFVANVGDAKAVVARSSAADSLQNNSDGFSRLKAIVLTREHKAIYPKERARIQKAGGSVSSNGRLQGRLEVSRAFGDRQFKKVGVVVTPDIHSFDLTEREHFIILGCDGLWGVFGPSDAVEFVHKLLKEGLSVATVTRRLVREAVRERRCKDNCTATVIVFRHK